MKLAFILFRYFPFGGLQRDFLKVALACQARGHEIHVFTSKWEGLKPIGLTITELSPKGWQNHTRLDAFIAKLSKELSAYRFDRVIGFNKMPGLDIYYAADSCFQAKTKKMHGAWFRWTPRYRHYIDWESAVFSKQSKTKILLLSPQQQIEFNQYYQTPPDRMTLLPPGISKDRIRKTPLKKPTRPIQLIFVGSGFRTKGLDRALIAISALPNVLREQIQFTVIGKDHFTPFNRLTKKLGIASKVNFLGGREDVPDFLEKSDLLIHPARNENTGTILLEALVAGLPVLTTDVCGYAHYIESANAGYLIPSPFEQSVLNEKLTQMLVSLYDADWAENALRFSKMTPLDGLVDQVIAAIEN